MNEPKLTGTAFHRFAGYWQHIFKVEDGEDPYASFKANLAKQKRTRPTCIPTK